MTRIALIGAGSVVFARNLVADILSHPALADADLRLMDTHPGRLDTARLLAQSIASTLNAPATITATTDRRKAIDGADFVISAIGVGGYEATKIDHLLPAEFGLRQTIGDTLGVGGIFRSLRGIPVLLDICQDMAELCPHALLLNYSNPMATHMLAVARATKIRHAGLCHGVANTARTMRMLVALKDIAPQEIMDHMAMAGDDPRRIEQWNQWYAMGSDPHLSYTCAGINHMAFFLRFESQGQDLYPTLRSLLDKPHLVRMDPVRFEVMRHFGWFMTETSAHSSEYLPWFLKNDAEIERMHLKVSSYLQTCQRQDRSYQAMHDALVAGRPVIEKPYCLSVEYASRILNAMVTNEPYVFNGNVHNRGGALISNLPGDSCVEVPCVADAGGIHPTTIGELPPQCAGMIRTNINVQDLVVRGLLEGDRRYITQAAMLDPNTASQLTLPAIASLVDRMFEAQKQWLPASLQG
jgi:alpha-galactosidase